jgi:predicted RNase H-like HicB family nuclease
MKLEDRYLMFVRWSDEDEVYVGYCPDLFPAGGVCHADTAVGAFAKLAEIVSDTIATAQEQGLPIPPALTRPMREIETVA